MGMSTRIMAFISDQDITYQKHLRIFSMCEKERVSLPKETEEYFKSCDKPEEKLEMKLIEGIQYKRWSADMEEGFEVDISKLPKEVSKIRVYNSY